MLWIMRGRRLRRRGELWGINYKNISGNIELTDRTSHLLKSWTKFRVVKICKPAWGILNKELLALVKLSSKLSLIKTLIKIQSGKISLRLKETSSQN